MDVDRRTLLLGAAFGAMLGASSPALACSRVTYSPLQREFWRRLWARSVSAPKEERRLAHRLVRAIADGSAEDLDKLFTPDALLFRPPDGTTHWEREARRFERAEGIARLAAYVSRSGERSFEIRHLGSLLAHSEFLVHASIDGYGPPVRGSTFGSSCGEDPNEWERRLVIAYRTESVTPGEPLRVQSLLWIM